MEDLYPTQIPLKELLSKKSLEKIHNVLSPVYFKKDTLLIKDSKLEKNAYFIQKGIIRAFINAPDKEITFWFPKEGDIISSAYGYYYQKKGYENYHVLEDSVLFKIDIAEIQNLYSKDLEISNWARVITERESIRSEERHLDYILLSPEDRYSKLLTAEPELFQRVQLKEIASYIGISPVSLSRIRARMINSRSK
ncbi:hypothetical protein D3C87_1495010 [compost metagenome]|jgi:CRP-like cAMP-binding protein